MSRVWDVPVHDSTRVRDARVAAEDACGLAGLDADRVAAAQLVATELATNLLKHAGGGRMVINLVGRHDDPSGRDGSSVQIMTVDHGPGMADVAAALRDGYTTMPTSLGAGLGTCARVAGDFDLHSTRGQGTVAMARIHPRRAGTRDQARRPAPGPAGDPARDLRVGGINVPLARAEHSGDAWACVRSGTRVTLLLADGLGHGERAADASGAAVALLRDVAHLPVDDILRRMDTALRGTRGAAVALAHIAPDEGQVHFAGIGNIGARLRTDQGWQPLVSHPGIVGAHRPATVPVQRKPWNRTGVLVLHSDGLPSRWTPPGDAELLGHDPAVTAATILRDASSAASPVRDDTCVAVLAPRPPDNRP